MQSDADVTRVPRLDEVTIEELDRDPFPVFDRLRREAPVFWHPRAGGWLLTRWEEVHRVLSDRELFGKPTAGPTYRRAFGDDKPIIYANGDLHVDLRTAVEPPMRGRPVRGYAETLIRPVVKRALAALDGHASVEMMSAYFEPISVRCLGDLLGFREVDDDTLRRWFAGLVSSIVNVGETEEGYAAGDRALAEIRAEVAPMIERMTAVPDGTVLSHMVHGGREGASPRTTDELMSTLAVYIAGGMQEPGHAAGSTLWGLLGEPEQFARVVADPALLPRAVQEGLRWIAPIGRTHRAPFADVELAGVPLEAGAHLLPVLLSANRDPAHFTDPDRFDIDRSETRMTSFGGGAHLCVGNLFGQSIIRIALEELVAVYPRLALDPERPAVVTGWAFRAPRDLTVVLDAAA